MNKDILKTKKTEFNELWKEKKILFNRRDKYLCEKRWFNFRKVKGMISTTGRDIQTRRTNNTLVLKQ